MLLIKQENAQAILNYLSTKPYGEVFKLIPIIVGLKKVEEEKHCSKPEDELPEAVNEEV